MVSRLATRWQVLAMLFLIRSAMGYQFQVVGSLGEALVDAYSIDYVQLGTLVGLYLTPGIVIALPSGFLGEWLGDRRTVLTALSMMIIGGIASAHADGFALAAAGRLLAGAGAVVLNVLLAKMVTDWFAGRELALGMAILVNSWPFGLSLGLVLQPAIAQSAGIMAAVYSTSLLLVLAVLLVLVSGRQTPPALAKPDHRGPCPLAKSEIAGSLVAGTIWGCYNGAILIVMSFAPAMLLAQGVGAAMAGRYVSIASWLGMVTVILGGWLATKRMNAKFILILGFAAGALAIAMMHNVQLRLLAFLIFGLIGFMPAGSIMALPASVLRPETRALGMGIYYTVFYAAVSVFPALAGLARDLTMQPAAPLWLAACLMAACMPFVLLFDRLPVREP
ncbi:MAG: MFS transporter [Pseudomonadota bacterium]